MAGEIFKKVFNKEAASFHSIGAVNDFVDEATGQKLSVKIAPTNLCSSRGSIFKIKKIDADKAFLGVLKKFLV